MTPHRLHFDNAARVMFTSSDHLTPVNALYFAERLFLAHNIPVPGARGGSSTNPGEIVQTW